MLDLVLLFQDQFLRDVEQRFERLEFGVLVGGQILIAAFIVVDMNNPHINASTFYPALSGCLLDDSTFVERS